MNFCMQTKLAFLACIVAIIDGLLTLAGQPTSYWRGDFSTAYELNPLGYVILELGPTPFASAMTVWAIVLSLFLYRLPHRWASALAFLAILAHGMGGAGWLCRYGIVGIALAVFYLVLLEQLTRSVTFARSPLVAAERHQG